jgi:hypothetical protein
MGADTDTSKSMIVELKRRIAKLQQIHDMLVEEYGQSAVPNTNGKAKHTAAGAVASLRGRRAHGHSGPTRKAQIHEWLKANGPAARGEIIKGSGLPTGTVGSLLSQCPELFENREGKWYPL